MSESLRDQLQANADKILVSKSEEPAPEAVSQTVEAAETTPAATEEAKPGRTAGRARDESGRLLPGKAERPQAPAQVTAKVAPAAAPAAPEKPRPKYPSTWKKDYAPHWESADPAFAEYLLQREAEYAKGVSTYKSQWDQARPLLDAIAPHRQMLEQYRIDPAKQIDQYFRIHQSLALGSPEQKLAVLAQIARDYQIPVQNLLSQGQDGQFYLNPNIQPSAPQITPDAIRQMVSAEMQRAQLNAQIQSFSEAKGPDGKPVYPHFEEVLGTMAGLLQAGIAQDLQDAYKRALLMPEHAELIAQEQATLQAEREAAEAAQRAQQVQRAKSAAVSVRTQTPSALPTGDKPKGLRDEIAQQVHARLGGGRV